jgi:ABC-type sugar transport system, permease component
VAAPGQQLRWRRRARLAGVFGIYLVRQYAQSIPDELLEAARIDGAGEWRIFTRIVLPLLKPIVVTWRSSRSWRAGTISCGR